ncbi:MAG: FAD-binding oxidoreductase [Pseudomonadota bacterium]
MKDLLFSNDRAGSYPPSYYAATATQLDPFPTAQGALKADVVIIGAGFTGLSAALNLAQAGRDVILLDAQRVGFGASGRNGGQIASGQRQDQDEIEALMGLDDARKLWSIAQEANQLVRDLSSEMPDCGVKDGIIHACHRKRYVAHEHDYAEKMARDYGYDKIKPLDQNTLRGLCDSPRYYGGALDMGAGHIHPLNFALGLARKCVAAGVRIFENSRVIGTDLAGAPHITTELAEIKADQLLMACNGYLGGLNEQVAARVMPINNFILATEPLDQTTRDTILRGDHAVADSKFVVNYFRFSDDHRMLFGGSESYGYTFPRDIAAKVRKPMEHIFPQLKGVRADYAWGGTLAITMRRMPYFARLSDTALNASGYSGSGVAMATMGGKMAALALQGQAERFDTMARIPTQRFPGGSGLRNPLLVAAMLWYQLRDMI